MHLYYSLSAISVDMLLFVWLAVSSEHQDACNGDDDVDVVTLNNTVFYLFMTIKLSTYLLY